VLAFTGTGRPEQRLADRCPAGWTALSLEVDHAGARLG
jgi:hypothetical protein